MLYKETLYEKLMQNPGGKSPLGVKVSANISRVIDILTKIV